MQSKTALHYQMADLKRSYQNIPDTCYSCDSKLPKPRTHIIYWGLFKSMNIYFRFKEKKSIPSGGELSVALTRHWVTCGSKPGVGGTFFSSLALFSFIVFVLRF